MELRVHSAAGEQRSEKIGRSQKLRSQSLEKVQSRESGLLGGFPKMRKSEAGGLFKYDDSWGGSTGCPCRMVRQVKEQPAVCRPCRPCRPCRLAWQSAQSTPARAIQSLPLPSPGSRGPGEEGDGRSHILLYALCRIRKVDSLDAVVMWTAFGTVLKVLLQHLAPTPSLEKQCLCWGPSQAISSNRQGRVS